ncbi:unnamed protein product [Rotaria magnacalcarata]|nr:unnamed protein product [Rotaria magnacalcarata]
MPLWFGRADPTFDLVQSNSVELLALLERIHNTSEDWSSKTGIMAKILVFDQFARSIYRGTAKAFQYDDHTRECVMFLLSKNWFLDYTAIERLFIIIALQHSELMEAQTMGVKLASTIVDNITENHDDLKYYFDNLKGFPHEHHDVIQQFGRFPGRNDAMGRESTVEEVEWLTSPDCPGWAKSQLKK